MPEKNSRFSIYSDEELMQFLCSGEVAAFDELYLRYGKRLMVYFVRMLNFNKDLAQDALQDLFLKIAEAPQKFDAQRSFKTWIFSVASNYCKNYYRHQQIKKENDEQHLRNSEPVHEESFLNLAGKMDGRQFRAVLDEVLKELSPAKREAFILKYQEEKSIAEIALIQDCPEGSVKSRLHYTLKLLEEKLKVFNPITN